MNALEANVKIKRADLVTEDAEMKQMENNTIARIKTKQPKAL